jgi:hypothetical protein
LDDAARWSHDRHTSARPTVRNALGAGQIGLFTNTHDNGMNDESSNVRFASSASKRANK